MDHFRPPKWGVPKWTNFEHFWSGPDQVPDTFLRPRGSKNHPRVIFRANALRPQNRYMSKNRVFGPQNHRFVIVAKRAPKCPISMSILCHFEPYPGSNGPGPGPKLGSPGPPDPTPDLGSQTPQMANVHHGHQDAIRMHQK